MDYRRIKESEQEQAIYIISQAFYYNCEGEYKQLEKNKFRFEDFLGAFTDEGKLFAVVQKQPHFMWLDGVSVKSGGICNVASLPEYRRNGAVLKLMKMICDEMYENEYTMSFLYPFSHPYYRKFGYELCNKQLIIEANPKDLLDIDFIGIAKQFEPGEDGTDPEDIITIYNIFASSYNIMLDRDAWQWEKHLENNPVKTKLRTYIIYDKKNKPISYFKFEYANIGHDAELSIRDMAWVDYEGMYQLMAFIGRLYGNVPIIKFHIPPKMIPSYLWKEPYEYTIKLESGGMARIINAKKALEVLHKPTSNDSFTIKIHDDFMEQNNKSYKVSWENNKTIVKEYDGECDLECSIMALVQILTGFIGFDKAKSRRDLVINDNIELLHNVFVKKDVYLADFF